MFDLNPVHLFYIMIGLSAAMLAEGVYLVVYNAGSYRKNINRRLKVVEANADRESVLVQLRRERGLTAAGDYRFSFFDLNRLLLQSGLSIGFSRLILFIGLGAIGAFAAVLVLEQNIGHAALAALFAAVVLPILVLKFLRARRQKMFGAQFADGLDMIVRSLRAGHPVPVAISMVAREMPDPIGSEFGIVGDEITYGAALETAMRNL